MSEKSKNSFRHFSNTACEYYPCHDNVDSQSFNCLFCYCPLYTLSDKCGGNFKFLSDGTKDCSSCLLPHTEHGYDHIMSKYSEIAKLADRKPNK